MYISIYIYLYPFNLLYKFIYIEYKYHLILINLFVYLLYYNIVTKVHLLRVNGY